MVLSSNVFMSLFALNAATWRNDNGSYQSGVIANDIPDIIHNEDETKSNYQLIKDVAQYKLADWSNVIGRARNVTIEQAKKIADADPNITFFFYLKGFQMVLENTTVNPAFARVFHHGDAVFFSGTPWWGSAPGLADGYVKMNTGQN